MSLEVRISILVCLLISLIFTIFYVDLQVKTKYIVNSYVKESINLKLKVSEIEKELTGSVNEVLRLEHCMEVNSSLNQRALFKFITQKYRRVSRRDAYLISYHLSEVCRIEKVPFELMVGFIGTESSFLKTALSSYNARGLCQVIYKWHKDRLKLDKEEDLHDIRIGIEAGAKVFSYYYAKNNKNFRKAMHAYRSKNASEKEVTRYINKILTEAAEFMLIRASMDDLIPTPYEE